MSKIYLSGPMTGLPKLNFPLFNAEAARLRGLGFYVVNPAELNPDGASWGDCMRKDIVALMSCDTVATLPGWENSKGAQLEVLIGERLEMAVVKAQDLVLPPAILPVESAPDIVAEPIPHARICGVGRDSKGNTVSMEIGVDIMPVPRSVELGEQLIFLDDHRAYAARLQAEIERLRYKAELYDEVWVMATGMGFMNVTTALDMQKRSLDEKSAHTAELEGLLLKVRETLQREYWDEHAGLDETRDIIDAALNKTEGKS
ncbi:DUF4406 domain-containing protein [Pseudomonas capsici]|uniref:DUF4406 domain-containing protein n=1 Tax=Pseudomonas capsici TaxID=2810614 RepID=UPI0021F15D94|nr:DUF4406 domain-containing protein [Pseudomonas capsici]MCV4287926.1 DUF4406 domain-containing protein [Pseudomonas capsici]